MGNRIYILACLGAATFGFAAAGCTGADPVGSSTTSGTAGGGDTTSSQGSSGSGGSGGAAPIASGFGDFVSAGEVCESSNYKLVFAFGQATPNQGKATSSKYRLQGGVIGSIQ